MTIEWKVERYLSESLLQRGLNIMSQENWTVNVIMLEAREFIVVYSKHAPGMLLEEGED